MSPPSRGQSRLSDFLAECLTVGCLRGFKHFELYLRGREELLVKIFNSKKTQSRQPSSKELAKKHTMKQKMRLKWQSTDNLPPASPCDRELERDPLKTVFLIAGYARYKSPFVWVPLN